MVVPRAHLSLFLKLLAAWGVLMAPGALYMGLWPWARAVGLAAAGLALVFLVGEAIFGKASE